MAKRVLSSAALWAVTFLPCAVLLGSGCLNATSEDTFIGGRSEMVCDGSFPACKGKYAGCMLDDSHYVRGNFPSGKKILVNTPVGQFKIRLLFFFEERRAPGTETEVSWYETGCSDQYRFLLSQQSGEGDLFERAGRTQVFMLEQAVESWGDHLIEFWSDSTCRYDLRVETVDMKK